MPSGCRRKATGTSCLATSPLVGFCHRLHAVRALHTRCRCTLFLQSGLGEIFTELHHQHPQHMLCSALHAPTRVLREDRDPDSQGCTEHENSQDIPGYARHEGELLEIRGM